MIDNTSKQNIVLRKILICMLVITNSRCNKYLTFFTVLVFRVVGFLKIENALKLDSVVLLELPCNFQQEGLE